MLAEGERLTIINIASVTAIVGWPRLLAYSASKGGVMALTRALAIDHAPDGIRVNVIVPGSTDTPQSRRVAQDDPAIRERRRAGILLGRLGTPGDVAYAAVYLASDESDFMTGHVLVVDGGYTAH